jgi:catechol 2,3-dioxygenase-like lactoylglutathione lyase family enzyme
MKIRLTSIYVDDQRAALDFYTQVLGFTVHHDIPLGDNFWLTVVSPEDPDGPQVLLEPSGHPAVGPTERPSPTTGSPWSSSPSTTSRPSMTASSAWGSPSPRRRPTSARPSWRSSTTRAATSSS